jgi:hypothetical protein
VEDERPEPRFSICEVVVVERRDDRPPGEGVVVWRDLGRPRGPRGWLWIYAVEMQEQGRRCETVRENRLKSTGRTVPSDSLLGKRPEVSYDLVMDPPPSFVDGSFRPVGRPWGVFNVVKARSRKGVFIRHYEWSNGIAGVRIEVPLTASLTRELAEALLGEALGIQSRAWTEVRGPDSMVLRPPIDPRDLKAPEPRHPPSDRR